MRVIVTALGIIGSLVGIYALYYALTTTRRRLLAFEASVGFPVATASRIGGDYELSVHFKASGGVEEKIEGAYLQLLRFANLGRESIYGRDNAPGNPVRIEVEGARVLDIAIADVKRDVNRILLSPPSLSGTGGSSEISFDFLDYGDGALIRVLTVGRADSIKIVGDVIGMPGGVICTSPGRPSGLPGWLLFGIWAITAVALLGLTAVIFRSVAGSWDDVWLLALPTPAVLLPIVLAAVLDESGSKLRRSGWRRRAYPEFELPRAFRFVGLHLTFRPGKSPKESHLLSRGRASKRIRGSSEIRAMDKLSRSTLARVQR